MAVPDSCFVKGLAPCIDLYVWDVVLYSLCELVVRKEKSKGQGGRRLCSRESEVWSMQKAMAAASSAEE